MPQCILWKKKTLLKIPWRSKFKHQGPAAVMVQSAFSERRFSLDGALNCLLFFLMDFRYHWCEHLAVYFFFLYYAVVLKFFRDSIDRMLYLYRSRKTNKWQIIKAGRKSQHHLWLRVSSYQISCMHFLSMRKHARARALIWCIVHSTEWVVIKRRDGMHWLHSHNSTGYFSHLAQIYTNVNLMNADTPQISI